MQAPLGDFITSIQSNHLQMIEQLHQWCSINSGTTNLNGLKQMATTIKDAYQPFADEIEIVKLPSTDAMTIEGKIQMQHFGDALFIRKRPHLTRRVLLCGHMDTVYAANSSFQSITTIDKNTLNGPGVADMKGGLIVMLQALKAFEMLEGSKSLGWDVFINTDEEIGSIGSAAFLQQLAPQYQTALVYEPAMTPAGMIAKNRKGSGKFTLVAKGKAAHAGRDFQSGKNAICHLAKVILSINALNQNQHGVTLNIGKIAGGDALNVVPDTAVVQIDVRTQAAIDESWVLDSLNTIIKEHHEDGYSLSLHGQFTRPVKRITKQTERLFERIVRLGTTIGLSLDWQDSGGCCDGNNLAHTGVPVIDTLGVRGGNIHSHQEYILLDSLTERTALSALLLHDLSQGGLEELHHDIVS